MTSLDWTILAVYIVLIVSMSWWIGRRQKNQDDYYLGGRRMPSWQIALSVMATQVSAISLISAPAFIALRTGGGLVWLQYEFAIPLAMMLIMLILVPLYHATGAITIYEYLEKRFGSATRSTIGLVFLVSRGLGTGVALLATGIVTAVCLNWGLPETILLIGVVAMIYTTFGGIVADIYSDILQLIILWTGALVAVVVLIGQLQVDVPGGSLNDLFRAEAERLRVFDLASTGLGDGRTFAFWPMLVGGLFLYLSYYGCDQSQAQRLLTTPTVGDAQKSLLINGLLRFPLVLTYCTVGVLLIPFLKLNSDFALTMVDAPPDYLVPRFLTLYMPKGLLGLLVAGIFAASMSSIDSAMNSLSAVTYKDFLAKLFPKLETLSNRRKVQISRWLTIFWGVVATGFALLMVGGSKTVLELVNQIGSAFYGPILAVFWLGMLTRRIRQQGAIVGLLAGVGVNVFLWQFYETQVSWMWWNVIGFVVTWGVAWLTAALSGESAEEETIRPFVLQKDQFRQYLGEKKYYGILLAAFVVFLLLSKLIEIVLTHL